MGYGKSGMGGAHPILKHMHKAGGGTGTKQAMSKNAEIKYGGPVIDQFKSPMKKMYGDTPLEQNPIKDAYNKAKSFVKNDIKVGGLSYNDRKKLKNTKVFSKKKGQKMSG